MQGPDDDAVRAEIDRELGLVDSAVALVRYAGVRRVTIASLRLGECILESARARARLQGAGVSALPDGDGRVTALVVEPGSG